MHAFVRMYLCRGHQENTWTKLKPGKTTEQKLGFNEENTQQNALSLSHNDEKTMNPNQEDVDWSKIVLLNKNQNPRMWRKEKKCNENQPEGFSYGRWC